jgi:hypothetical protein
VVDPVSGGEYELGRKWMAGAVSRGEWELGREGIDGGWPAR